MNIAALLTSGGGSTIENCAASGRDRFRRASADLADTTRKIATLTNATNVRASVASVIASMVVLCCASNVDARPPSPVSSPSAVTTVDGTVHDTNGQPLAGVTIVLSGAVARSAVTDVSGRFVVSNIALGTYALSVTRSGYEAARQNALVVGRDSSGPLDVTLAPATLASLRVIGQTSAGPDRSRLNTTAAALALIAQPTFVDQGELRVARVLDETPGIVTGHASAAFPGSSAASPVALVSPSIRGGLPWETATLVDGHPVAVAGDGFYWLQSINALTLDSVEVSKGPGAASIVDNDAINGSVNFRTLDPTARRTGAIMLGSDNYGGLFSNVLARGSTRNGRLGWVLDYAVDGSPGPLRNFAVPIATNFGTNPAGQTIGGFTVAANPYAAASPAPGILNSYQGSKTSLIACCEPLNSTYTSKTELLKLRYALSGASVLTASYFGNQLYTLRDGYGIETLASTFAPGSTYTGPLSTKAPVLISAGSYLPPGESLTNNEPMFNFELRTTRKNDTLLARVYSDSLNVNLANGLTAPSQPYATTFASVNGTFTSSTCPKPQKTCTVTFNGTPAAAVLPGQYNATPVTDHLLGGSFEYDHIAGANVFSIGYDESSSTASWIKTSASYPAIGATYLVPTANYVIPPGSNAHQRTLLLRAYMNVTPAVTATLSTYFNMYANRFDTDQVGGLPAGETTRGFAHADPRLGLTYRVNGNAGVRFSAGSSTAPPFLQLYQVSTAPTVTSAGVIYSPNATTYAQFLNNPDLRPETAFGYDVGGEFRLRDGLTVLSVDGYLNNLWNQFFEAVSDSKTIFNNGKNGAGELYNTRYANLSQARYEGIELAVRRDPPRGLGFIAQGALQKAYPYNLPPGFYGSNGKAIANLGVVPGLNYVASNSNNQTGGFNATAINTSTISVPYAQGYAELSERFGGGARVSLGTTYYGPNNSYGVPAFFVSNATARYALDRRTTAQLSADNIFAVHTALFIGANGGVAVPLANGSFGRQNANTVGPTTLRLFVARTFDY